MSQSMMNNDTTSSPTRACGLNEDPMRCRGHHFTKRILTTCEFLQKQNIPRQLGLQIGKDLVPILPLDPQHIPRQNVHPPKRRSRRCLAESCCHVDSFNMTSKIKIYARVGHTGCHMKEIFSGVLLIESNNLGLDLREDESPDPVSINHLFGLRF